MTLDFDSADESYDFFLAEAQDLLTTLEQGLLNLKENCTPAKLHSLMRAAHTLKGAAASVERDAIKKVAHVLEDVFNALYSPNAHIDENVEALLFEGYECLRLLFHAEFTGGAVDESSILNRAATVIARLQDILGDCFNAEPAIPTSAELGFDLVESMFKSGVAARLDRLRQVLDQGNPDLMRQELQSQAEVLLGLAESLNLPGFGAIAQTTLNAIEAHPQQVLTIASLALDDFNQGQTAVLQGDRTQGGIPSPALCQLAESGTHSSAEMDLDLVDLGLAEPPPAHASKSAHPEADALPPDGQWQGEYLNSLLAAAGSATTAPNQTNSASSLTPIAAAPPADPPDGVTPLTPIPIPSQAGAGVAEGTHSSTAPANQRPSRSSSQSVRISVEQLHRLDHAAGELLTHQTQQHRELDQLYSTTQNLLNRLQTHLATLQALQSWTGQTSLPKPSPSLLSASSPPPESGAIAPTGVFDALELDDYSEIQTLTRRALDEAVSLETLATGVHQTLKQSKHGLQTQRQLLRDVQDDVTSARMQSLGDLLNRFHRTLQQLVVTYGKRVTLEIQGGDILVDRVIVEKLYDPLLHLIRNAFDHGIELPEVRRSRGKPEVGRIQIRAFNRGCYTVVEVEDDGAGIDPQAVVQQGLHLGLVTPEQIPHMGQADIFELLFHAGFSTTSSLSDLSGRGIGLDVVRSQMAELRGDVTLQSTRHQGTTFALRVPLSLTIQSVLLAEAAGQVYALPVSAIERVVIPEAHALQTGIGQPLMLQLPPPQAGADGWARVYPLADYLTYSPVSRAIADCAALHGSSGFAPISQEIHPTASTFAAQSGKMQPVMLLNLLSNPPSGRRGLQVDRILGEQELVIRPFDAAIAPPSYLHGCCVLGNRQLVLVVDPIAFLTHVTGSPPTTGAIATTPAPATLPPPMPPPRDRSLPSQTADRLPPLPRSSIPIILVIDDSATVRQSLSTVLRQGGYQVLEASNGAEAINCLHQYPHISAVICDIEMPYMNGFQFLHETRDHEQFRHLPILMLTSRSSPKHRQIAIELGADDYLTKPYRPEALLDTLGRLPILSSPAVPVPSSRKSSTVGRHN